MAKLKIALIFGGRSGEHEVSLQSAKSIYTALDKQGYEIFLIGLDKSGKWYLGNNANYLLNTDNPKLITFNKSTAQKVTAISHDNGTQLIAIDSGKQLNMIDVVFPITHGTFGEDGSLQGFLELLDVAYVGAGVLGSAVGMDKDIMKRLLNAADIKIAKYVALKKNLLNEADLENAEIYLDYPIFVKPANLGSSVGITKAHDRGELAKAIKFACEYDTKILLEETIIGREIELAVLGNDSPKASIPGEVLPNHEFYSYEAKYIDEHGARLEIPAKLDENTIKKLQDEAIKAFTVLECSGMARVDFFLKENGDIVLNEINTLPGFTKISMYPKLWEASGLSYNKLLDILIELAMQKKQDKDTLKRIYG